MFFSSKSLTHLCFIVTMTSQFFNSIKASFGDENSRKTIMVASSHPQNSMSSGTTYEYVFNNNNNTLSECSMELTTNGNLIVRSHVQNEWKTKWQSESGEDTTSMAAAPLYYLHLQKNHGNLVIYRGIPNSAEKSDAIWAAHTGRRGVELLQMSDVCDLYLQKRDGTDVWTTLDSTGMMVSMQTLSTSAVPSEPMIKTHIPSVNNSPSPSIDPTALFEIDIDHNSSSPSIVQDQDYFNDTVAPTPIVPDNFTMLETSAPSLLSTDSSIPSGTPTGIVNLIIGNTAPPTPFSSNIPSGDDFSGDSISTRPSVALLTNISLLPTTGNFSELNETAALSIVSSNSFISSNDPSLSEISNVPTFFISSSPSILPDDDDVSIILALSSSPSMYPSKFPSSSFFPSVLVNHTLDAATSFVPNMTHNDGIKENGTQPDILSSPPSQSPTVVSVL